MKKVLIIVLALTLVWAIQKCNDERQQSSEQTQTEQTASPSDQRKSTPKESPATETLENALEIPLMPKGVQGELIPHTGYTAHYNTQWLIPNWVAYELTPEEAEGSVPREGEFQADPNVRGLTAQPSDYKRSGYDRGHMAPAGDLKFSHKTMHESFYLSNICPQNHDLNIGLWADLEKKVRKWARQGDTLYIACGPIVKPNFKTIGRNGVAVPQEFFKVLCRKANGKVTTLGFIFPNEKCRGTIYNYSMSVDDVERATGFDFFSLLPDDIEESAERSSDLRMWQ